MKNLMSAVLFLAAAGIAAAQTPAPAATPAAPAATPAAPALPPAPATLKIGVLQAELALFQTREGQAAKDELQRQITTKTRNLQREAQDFQDEQQAEGNKAMADLEEKMKAVIYKYAAENGLSLILNVSEENSPVLYVATSLDITQAIIDAYDKAYPAKAGAPKGPLAPAPKGPIAPAPPKPPAPAPAKP